MVDNAFVGIDDWARAQDLADAFRRTSCTASGSLCRACCPACACSADCYHWSLMQVEYATDLVFRAAPTLGPLYEQLVRDGHPA